MTERHRWSISISGWIKVKRKIRIGTKILKIKNVVECENCGLMKGILGDGRFHITVYFNKDHEYLSQDILPYKCIGKKNTFYLTKEDFYV